ncbi:MAG: metallophosphoesterase [Treponema sp.]|nr:metallophosphoesterase [Treponema sp.]
MDRNARALRLAIGDTHGRSFWKSYIKEEYKEFYFTGDYFDSFDIPFPKQQTNFLEICEAARTDNRIKMCLGNHDYHYLEGVNKQQYSGFQDNNHKKISAILEKNMDLLKIVFVTKDNFIISHAGITEWFLNSIGGKRPEDINKAFEKDRNVLIFNGINVYGDDITQSPIWVRPGSLQRNPLPGYSQIVGHTPVRKIIEDSLNGADKLILIDTHDTKSIYRF